jgi:hypothetical protein
MSIKQNTTLTQQAINASMVPSRQERLADTTSPYVPTLDVGPIDKHDGRSIGRKVG